jgi:hypothetical protein
MSAARGRVKWASPLRSGRRTRPAPSVSAASREEHRRALGLGLKNASGRTARLGSRRRPRRGSRGDDVVPVRCRDDVAPVCGSCQQRPSRRNGGVDVVIEPMAPVRPPGLEWMQERVDGEQQAARFPHLDGEMRGGVCPGAGTRRTPSATSTSSEICSRTPVSGGSCSRAGPAAKGDSPSRTADDVQWLHSPAAITYRARGKAGRPARVRPPM